ncbi:carbohydrate ABC transporter permease [Paenibacillus filicis]|uniref:Carbohydrate ABC transporter permease n=1 Tax=Paenibacillus filicis TaxID=669464 RepID=A0ABU9DSH0_9BACL
MTPSFRKKSLGSHVFDVINVLFLLFLMMTMIIPFLNTFALAFSTGFNSMQPTIVLWPEPFSLEGFATIWSKMKLYTPVQNNTIVTIVGTTLHVILASLGGYVLVQPGLPGKKTILSFILVTMTIPSEAVMIPLYVVYKDFHLINSLWAVINYGLIGGFSILLMRNYFSSIPIEMSESARIDGAGDWRIFFTMYLPLAKAGLATVTLFEFIGKWNHFTPALLFINQQAKYTLQIALKALVIDSDTSSNLMITTNVRMAGIVIAVLPLIIIYPFVQKYFVKGTMVGANKE